jgi:hypothetical protein
VSEDRAPDRGSDVSFDTEGGDAWRWQWLWLGVTLACLVMLALWLTPRIRWAMGVGRPVATPSTAGSNVLKVWVWDAQGAPVPGGATVELWAPGQASPTVTTKTAFNGGVDVALPAEVSGWAGLRLVGRLGPLVSEKVLAGKPGATCTLTLPVSVSLRGRIAAAGPDAAPGGWTVSLGSRSVVTGADGTFRLAISPRSAAPWDPIVLTVVGPDSTVVRFPLKVPIPEGEVVFTLPR